MTEYITVKDGIVTGHFASRSDTVPDDGIVVEKFLAPIGFYYDEDYEEKDGYIVLKPYIELFKNGHMVIPDGYKVNDEGTDIVPYSDRDNLEHGLITVEEYNALQKQHRQEYYANNLDQLTMRKTRKMAIGEWTEKDDAEYHALCDKIALEIEELYPYES